MLLKEYLKQGKKIIPDNISSVIYQFYSDTPNWLSAKYVNLYTRTILAKYSNREIYTESESETLELTELMFLANYDKYKHIFDLLEMEYNPLWNVDGTETTTRNLTDNKTSSNTGTDTLTHNTIDATTSSATTTYNTTDTTTFNTTDGKNTTDSRTTYDSSTFLDTDKSIDSMTKTGTEATAKTGTDGTSGTDSTTHTGTDTTQRTNNGTEGQTVSESITLKRQGNIGVISTVDLMKQDFEFSERYRRFVDIVCIDIVKEISVYC